ncbi:MAG: aminopeptidase [Tenericutes bacterium HGW-Tenericutes-8]|nr:MAG: aminopeptidase [Tenericutes bacterium HGW-Tenericutes-8]
MKSIDLETIDNMHQSYEGNVLHKAMRRALSKNSLDTLTYVTESESKTQFKFSIDIDTLPAANQKASGRCWLFAGLNVLRELVAKKHNLKEFEFSQNYQAFWDKFEKINYFIESMDDFLTCDQDDRTLKHLLQQGIQDGGQWDMFVSLVEKYGVVPKEAMPETFQSSNTALMNKIINIKLRKYAFDARTLASNHQTKVIPELKKQTLNELYGFLCDSFGIPPKQFDFEFVDEKKQYVIEKDITPVEFYHRVGINLSDYQSVIHAPTKDKPYMKTYTVAYLGNVIGGKDIKHLNLEMDRLIELIVLQLKTHEVVWFGADVQRDGDREKGIWNDQAYDYETALQMSLKLSKEARLDYLQGAMNHAMVITGVNLDENLPTKWKIENSWGTERGLKGYYIMSQTWFYEHTYQAVVHKKFLNEKELEALKQSPIVLKPWDPMGSLA